MEVFFKRILWSYVIFLIVFLFSWQWENQSQKQSPWLEVYFLDVGQGDAVLINYLKNKQILIDGGSDGQKLIGQLNKFISPVDNVLEVVVATHPDKDHIGGLTDALRKYQVGLLLENGQKSDSQAYQQLEEIIQNKNIRRENIFEGSKIRIGKFVNLEAFNPDFNYQEKTEDKERNNDSVVLRMDFGVNSFLFLGDVGFQKEKDLIFDQEKIDVDFLKVAHHGSKNSSSSEFLEKVTPQVAVISAGKDNSYGHPAQKTLERLEKSGAKIFRTDQGGTVAIVCFAPQKNCQANYWKDLKL